MTGCENGYQKYLKTIRRKLYTLKMEKELQERYKYNMGKE